jgi:DNA-binding response OmpR family regulator
VASGNDILATACETQPMVNALNHRNQLVQIYAALALGWAAPSEKYPGMENVVPLLGRILAGSRSPVAVLIIPDAQKRSAAATAASAMGYAACEAESFDTGMQKLMENPADVELVVVDYNLATPSVDQVINRIRENNFLRLVPNVVTVTPDRLADATTVLGRQLGLTVVPEGTSPQALVGQVDYLRKQMGRVILSKNEVVRNSLLAVNALERLAKAKIAQYNVEVVRENLTQAMNCPDWTLGIVAAKVLSLLPSAEAQRNLADAAICRKDVEQKVCLLNFLAEAIRSYCNKLTAAQVGQLQDLVINETNPAIRQATAKVLGAMNLVPQVARKVLLAKEPFGSAK